MAATKATKKTTTKKPTTEVKADALRQPQVRILTALNKHGDLSRAEVAAKASTDYYGLTEQIGSTDKAIRLANDKKHFPSLISLGYVTVKEADGKPIYSITKAGREWLARLSSPSGSRSKK